MRTTWRWVLVAVLFITVGVGCGAMQSLQRAREGFSRAEASGAKSKAVYEYHAAEIYLQLADEEFDENDFKQAEVYAAKSLAFSERAVQTAGGGDR